MTASDPDQRPENAVFVFLHVDLQPGREARRTPGHFGGKVIKIDPFNLHYLIRIRRDLQAFRRGCQKYLDDLMLEHSVSDIGAILDGVAAGRINSADPQLLPQAPDRAV